MLERFKTLKVGALFSQMGTGKTRVALELVRYNHPDFLLYICPFSCKANIDAELKKWGVDCEYEIVGYETLSGSDRKYTELRNKLDGYEKKFIIADESIFIKKGTTKRHRRALALREKCQYALVLNGTPITNNERDIYNQMEFLSHKIFNMYYYEFLQTFFIEHVYKDRRSAREIHVWDFYEPNRPAFSKVIAPYVYMADLVFEKQEKSYFEYVPVDVEYKLERDRILEGYMSYSQDSIISLFTVLASIAAETQEKNERVAEYIDGRKCIVYCSRKDEMRQIAEQCDCFMITGDTKEEDRKRIVKEFTECDNKPLVLSYGVGAYSLNLQTAHEIVYSSLTFNFGQYEQSKFRIKRMGQEQDIQYTYILPDAGIIRTMRDNLESKTSLAEEIKYHIKHCDLKEWLQKAI